MSKKGWWLYYDLKKGDWNGDPEVMTPETSLTSCHKWDVGGVHNEGRWVWMGVISYGGASGGYSIYTDIDKFVEDMR